MNERLSEWTLTQLRMVTQPRNLERAGGIPHERRGDGEQAGPKVTVAALTW